MELKTYQAAVLNDFDRFLACLATAPTSAEAYRQHWEAKQVRVGLGAKSLRPYQDSLSGAPSICIKVPTAGGKTFLGVNAVHRYFATQDPRAPRVVAWLVPSLTILDQTITNFRDPEHPYRRKWDSLFQGRFQVLSKDEALAGTGFSPESVRSQLTVVVFSFDSFRTQNKDGRKVYQENGALSPFADGSPLARAIPNADATSLAQVVNTLKPMVVVDESHNATSDLSLDMVRNLNPRLVLELTATPRSTSNIISFVDSLALKVENMVKLPVVVYNNHDAGEVIHNALALRQNLEIVAKEESLAGGSSIRPTILFQAEPRGSETAVTFQKLKERLVEFGVPGEQIAIKTADINELKGIRLEDPECPIRYIITVNALKEGWDCPFAYILATVANRTSPIDVEQILGRILRQPFVRTHRNPLLNMSYVLTGSADFLATLDKIVNGLNKAGFSKNDYRISPVSTATELTGPARSPDPGSNFLDDIVPRHDWQHPQTLPTIQDIKDLALEADTGMSQTIETFVKNPETVQPTDLQGVQDVFEMKPAFRSTASGLELPQFVQEADAGLFTVGDQLAQMVGKSSLLRGFRLGQQDATVSLEGAAADAYKVDMEVAEPGQATPEFKKLDQRELEIFLKHLGTLNEEEQRKEVLAKAWPQFGRFDYVSDKELKDYLSRIIDGLDATQLTAVKQNPWGFGAKVKLKVSELADRFAEAQFERGLAANQVVCMPRWKFPLAIHPLFTKAGVPKSLYAEEEAPNGFELRVINDVANTDSVGFWHRNIERQGFQLNGWINHFPDFIIYTTRGNLLLLETKGDDRDNSDSAQKLRLGRAWEAKAGPRYKYFMVFDQNPITGAHRLDDFLSILKHL